MASHRQSIDTVRPSRDGHEFHEAWTARKAMQLLLPKDGLIGIAVEGLSEEDQSQASPETVEIADLTVYYGKDTCFRDADRVETLQFKYSPKRAERQFRASDARRTIEKFAASYLDYKRNHDAAAVAKKLTFELITNRPVFAPLQAAIEALAEGKRLTGQAKMQAEQLKKASGLTGKPLAEFAGKCCITGLAGTLRDTKADLSKILVDWSATADAKAKARLGDMRDMIRRKAGYDAEHKKVIRQVDVLNALGLSDVADLLPCQPRLPTVGEVVEREQLSDAAALIPSLTKPLVIHADGGIGKTVFLESLASILSKRHEIAFFDCFGGGAYRAPEDGRHLPGRGLMHIVNELACRGLCDPILPDSNSTETLFATFRRRLQQCVATLTAASPEREVVLFIDAIDNAAEYAHERGQRAFPVLLLESIHLSGPIPGVRIVASGRTHRAGKYLNQSHYQGFELRAFSPAETRTYISARLPDVTDIEISVAQSRSEGNGRILEHLVTGGRGLLDPSEIDKPIVLNELLRQQINSALSEAQKQGYKKEEIDAFLAGLSVLPPPIPLDEYAGAHSMDISAIRSFASDLAPLLDRTPQGMIFRDEPTETLVRETYGTNKRALKCVANNLLARQEASVYAAQALPGLLQRLGEGEKLFNLAFDERFPAAIQSTVGQRRIRYARLKAAVLHAAGTEDKNRLVRLLVEFSSVTASDRKGADYIQDNPDLVVNAADADALRRLFETRTKWPGARHARLTIASVLSGDLEEAARHFRNALAWVRHDIDNPVDNAYDRPTPEHIDRAAIGLFRLAQGEHRRAIGYMRVWYPWYSFELCEHMLELCQQFRQRTPHLRSSVESFLDDLKNDIGPLAAALSFTNFTDSQSRSLVERLAKACTRTKRLTVSGRMGRDRSYELPDGLRKAAAIALSLGMDRQALNISLRAPHTAPGIWAMNSQHYEGDVFPFLFRIALKSAVSGIPVHERDILPSDLTPFAKSVGRALNDKEFKEALKTKIARQFQKQRKSLKPDKSLRNELKADTDRFLDHRLTPFLQLTQALAAFLRAPRRHADRPFQDLIRLWANVRKNKEGYYYKHQFNHFFQSLGTTIIMFTLWSRSDLKSASVRLLLKNLHEQNYLAPPTLIRFIAIIARRPRFDVIAGEQAVHAKTLVEREDDVTTRSGMFADLARAILPVSSADAAEYFRTGLEQLDAIGSGDYDFTNELLLFASSITGDELSEQDTHTLTNICELNMSYEAEKFPWAAFAGAMSRVSGPRALAKLSRWHDRGKITLEYTLLPYLTALVQDEKIAPEDAIALNRLATPVELWVCNTEALAIAIHDKRHPNAKALITELIRQYDNHPRLPSGATVKTLAEIANDVFGKRHATTRYLAGASKRFNALRDDLNDQSNYQPLRNQRPGKAPDDTQQKMKCARTLAADTDPLDEGALENAASQLKDEHCSREVEREFFSKVRGKVRNADRRKYLSLVAHLEQIDSYAKFNELAECKKIWSGSSASLASFYRDLAPPILDVHAEEFLSFDRLSGYRIKEVSDITGVPVAVLSLELTKIFAAPDWTVPAAAWLGLATIVNRDAAPRHAQTALAKLLNSGSARLTDTVPDGPWKRGLYPAAGITDIAAGLVWQMLGSPRATDRWQAVHSVRCFARFGRWNVIDALVGRLESKSSESFGAPELRFLSLHAKLWLLIALARSARDWPSEIARHSARLMTVALDRSHPHVVMRHFAAQAVLACDKPGAAPLSQKQRTSLETANQSLFPHRANGERYHAYSDFYRDRPEGRPEPTFEFHLDFDFDKHEVHGLAGVFAQPGWEVRDLVKTEAHRLDPSVTSMYEEAGRETPSRRGGVGLTSGFHVYGQYLAWHALYFAAAQMLAKHSITENWEHGQRWSEWLSRELLTRSDGLWLSDGMDRPPVRTQVTVLEKGKKSLVLTGVRDKLMCLAGIENRTIGHELVVEGDWKSPDGVGVHISSALIPARFGRRLAKALLEEGDASSIWLPRLNYDDEDHDRFRTEKREYMPWIVCPLTESGGLDDFDPLSVISVERRPRFIAKIAEEYSLQPGDPFRRSWRTPRNRIVATTDAWGYEIPYEEGGETGVRLLCKSDFLSRVLERQKTDLVLLIKLTRYEKGQERYSSGRFSHTAAALRVTKHLRFEYFAGPVNQTQQLRF